MNETRHVKWLLVGAGDIARSRVAAALSCAANSEIAGIYGRSVGNAERLAEKWGCPRVYHDYAQALRESGADAVYIATPHHVHVPMALQALDAGKHFLAEKPLGVNAAECEKLLAASKSHPELVVSCSNYRLFSNQFRETRRLIEGGELGALVCGWAQDEEPYYNPSNAPLLVKDGMSPILGFGFYLVNMAQAIFGLPEAVMAMTASFNCAKKEPFDIDDVENVILRFPGGRMFTLHLNMASVAPLRHAYEFEFEYGRLLWPACPPHFNAPIEIVKWGGGDKIEASVTPASNGAEKPNWHLPMVQDFVNCVLSGGVPVCTLESAVRTAEITEAILRSAAEGRVVTPVYR